MAEAIEINFPTESDKNPKIDSEIKNQILGFTLWIKVSDRLNHIFLHLLAA